MNEAIKVLVDNKKYDEALKKIENILNTTKFDLNKAEDEEKYTELIQQRIMIKTLAGKKDEFVADFVNREKFSSKINYSFNNGHKISLQLIHQFLIPCDAYVELINPITYFEGGSGAGPRANLKALRYR